MISKIAIIFTLGLCSLGLVAAGCGGGEDGDGPLLTVEQYFAQLQEADDLASSRFERIRSQLDQGQPDGPNLQVLRDVFPQQVATLRDLVETLEALPPPAEVRGLHDAAVEALNHSIDVTKRSSDSIQAATSLQEAGDILASPETTEADQATRQTCLALEQAGTERGISVDLDC